jgi:arginyl-tRNA--protein-N-Asp/Glu arginylyltransferase
LTSLHDFAHALVLRQQGKSEQAEQMHRQGLENYEKVLGNVQVQFDLARSMAKNKSMARSQLVLEAVRGICDVLESGLQDIRYNAFKDSPSQPKSSPVEIELG